MKFKLRPKALAVFLLIICNVNNAMALSASEYASADEQFKAGYVFGMMEALTQIADSDPVQNQHDIKMLQCFLENKIDSAEGVRIVSRYILRTPDASTTPMVGVVIKAFNEACDRYFK
jgi:hypothetical protein